MTDLYTIQEFFIRYEKVFVDNFINNFLRFPSYSDLPFSEEGIKWFTSERKRFQILITDSDSESNDLKSIRKAASIFYQRHFFPRLPNTEEPPPPPTDENLVAHDFYKQMVYSEEALSHTHKQMEDAQLQRHLRIMEEMSNTTQNKRSFLIKEMGRGGSFLTKEKKLSESRDYDNYIREKKKKNYHIISIIRKLMDKDINLECINERYGVVYSSQIINQSTHDDCIKLDILTTNKKHIEIIMSQRIIRIKKKGGKHTLPYVGSVIGAMFNNDIFFSIYVTSLTIGNIGERRREGRILISNRSYDRLGISVTSQTLTEKGQLSDVCIDQIDDVSKSAIRLSLCPHQHDQDIETIKSSTRQFWIRLSYMENEKTIERDVLANLFRLLGKASNHKKEKKHRKPSHYKKICLVLLIDESSEAHIKNYNKFYGYIESNISS
ncbi:MAG: hypothetical protein HQL53_08480 [Magnetococcales bacterium]|nr:hypothetical protein [Magnetococcales bacterium]